MADRIYATIEDKAVMQSLFKLEAEAPKLAARVLNAEMTFLKDRMILVTPILTGFLRANFLVVPATVRSGGIVEGSIENLDPKAFEVHENPNHKRIGFGPVSRIQPVQPEGRVGPKFMTRVIDFHKRDTVERLAFFAEADLKKLVTGRP